MRMALAFSRDLEQLRPHRKREAHAGPVWGTDRGSISGHQWSSAAISGYQWPSEVIRGHQWSSVVIRGHYLCSRLAAIRSRPSALRRAQYSASHAAQPTARPVAIIRRAA
jgi:hypothetical protein